MSATRGGGAAPSCVRRKGPRLAAAPPPTQWRGTDACADTVAPTGRVLNVEMKVAACRADQECVSQSTLKGPTLPKAAARVPPTHTPCYTAPAWAPVRSAGCCSSTRGACVHPPGETCPPAGGAGVLRKARSRGGGADRPGGMPLRDSHVSADLSCLIDIRGEQIVCLVTVHRRPPCACDASQCCSRWRA